METIIYDSQYERKYFDLIKLFDGTPEFISLRSLGNIKDNDLINVFESNLRIAENSLKEYISYVFKASNSNKFSIFTVIDQSIREKIKKILDDEKLIKKLEIIIKKPNFENIELLRKRTLNYEENKQKREYIENYTIKSINLVLESLKRLETYLKECKTNLFENIKSDAQTNNLYVYKINPKIKSKFLKVSSALMNQLKDDGYIESISVTHFRSLASTDETYSRYHNVPIKWLKGYNTLSYFIKNLKPWFIDSTIQQNMYDIAVKRFYNKLGQPFNVKKERHDKDPNLIDKTNIDNIIESVKRTHNIGKPTIEKKSKIA